MSSDGGTNSALMKLGEPRERFLARVVGAALERGWRTADDFLRYFPPGDLMDALEGAPEVRVRVLVDAAGIPRKIAARRSQPAAREDLEIAVEEGLTDAAGILAVVPLDVRIRCFDAASLFRFALEGDWLSRAGVEGAAISQAAERISFVLGAALAEGLISMRDVAQGLSVDQMAGRVSPIHLRKVFVYAMNAAQQGTELNEGELLDLIDLPSLLADIPFEQTWQNVILARVAPACGLPTTLDTTGALPPGQIARPETVRATSVPAPRPRASLPAPAPRTRATPAPRPRSSVPAPAPRPSVLAPPASRAPLPAPVSRARVTPVVSQSVVHPGVRGRIATLDDSSVEMLEDDIEVDEETEVEFTEPIHSLRAGRSNARGNGADRAGGRIPDNSRRRAVTDLLRSIERLPANHEYLSLAILRSIAVMYDEIKTRRGKVARAQCVRECFDNEAHLRTGLLALIDLLDPGMTALLGDAPSDALVDSLLVQERTIWQRARGRRASLPPASNDSFPPASRRGAAPSRANGGLALPLTRVAKPGWKH